MQRTTGGSAARNPPYVRSRPGPAACHAEAFGEGGKPTRRTISACLPPQQRTSGPLHVPDELAALAGRRRRQALDVLALRRDDPLPRKEDEDRGKDGEIRQERIDLAERALALPLLNDIADRGEDRVHHAERLAIDVGGARRELAQHDGGKPRAGRGF